MTPDEIAVRVPRLYHYADERAWPFIERYGLLTAAQLVHRFVQDGERRSELLERPRQKVQKLHGGLEGSITLNDNAPLRLEALAPYLDDGLTPYDWLRMLNERVYFWPKPERGEGFSRAGRRNGRRPMLLVLDTASVAQAAIGRLALSPINTGSAVRRPARRGLQTFVPASEVDWGEWRRLRGRLDTVTEVSVRDGVPDLHDHLVETRSAESLL